MFMFIPLIILYRLVEWPTDSKKTKEDLCKEGRHLQLRNYHRVEGESVRWISKMDSAGCEAQEEQKVAWKKLSLNMGSPLGT